MEKELVKVGMKVIYTHRGRAFNCVVVGDAFLKKGGFELSYYIDGKWGEFLFDAMASSFEPYEEPRWTTYKQLQQHFNNQFKAMFTPQENPLAPPSVKFPKEETTTYQVKDLEGNVIEEKVVEDKPKGFVINLDALEQFGTNLETGEKITPKEILDLFVERGTMISRSEDSPITQEFIESFGFVKVNECKYNFISQEKDSYFLEAVLDKFSLYAEPTAIMGENKEYIFQDFTCTTQSELRFLLTKGRIDCSK